jgi:enoyl-CoA hydratase/carnithine racemase
MTEKVQESVCIAPLPPPGAAVEPAILRETEGNVAVLTMQHPPHNLLGRKLMGEITSGVVWAAESGARCVVLRSALRHFSAGAEMEEFACAERGEAPDLNFAELLKVFDNLPMPILASVHGTAVGGGLELALAADLIVAAESAKLGAVEVALGVVPIMGGVQRLTQRAGAARAREMTMFGRRYDARTLERWNIINRVVADADLGEVTLAMAHELANGPTVALASIKKLVSIAERDGIGEADKRMAEVQLDVWRSQDLKDGIASLIAKGPGFARFEGR